jgi:RNA 2',3'-cyclic 3'-phosphodiesterase
VNAPPGTSWRLFFAVELPANARHQIASHITQLRQLAPSAGASWSRESNIHLTLKFLGNVLATQIDIVSAAGTRAVAGLQPFTLRIQGTGSFPQRGTPRVLWIGINDGSGKLQTLQARLEDECAAARFAREDRAFHPHLTLARLKQVEDAGALAAAHRALPFAAITLPVEELCLFRSELSSKGSRYTILSKHRIETNNLQSSI